MCERSDKPITVHADTKRDETHLCPHAGKLSVCLGHTFFFGWARKTHTLTWVNKHLKIYIDR